MPHPLQTLTDKEIKEFVEDLDHDNNGYVDYWELEKKLDEVHKEIAAKPQPHNLHYQSRSNDPRHDFLRSVLGTKEERIPREEFEKSVKNWGIPSLEQDRKAAEEEDSYVRNLSPWRRLRSYWAVRGPEILFLFLVLAFMLAFGIWQLIKYITSPKYRPAFGWGVVVAKTSAGILYPTFFFLILSMSRWFSTSLRRFYFVSRFINWDLSQSFHVKISIIALFFASLHAIGHLTGSFVFGSKKNRQEAVANVLGQDAVPKQYGSYIGSLPGITGITALGLFYILALLSQSRVRKWSYELFQGGHLLMFPIIGLLMAHGTAGLMQWPMFGYWLAFPTLMVLLERLNRFIMGFRRISATLEILDEETVAITAEIPKTRLWPYKAGQYVLVQVPKISLFQWHPFTISTSSSNTFQVHIKADGDWTCALRKLAKEGTTSLKIGLDGPFGAPAQRFYDFEYSIVFGAGIGVTPFSGILTDLQAHELERSKSAEASRSSSPSPYSSHRRIDFHWMVRSKNNLLWFSDLLNSVSKAQSSEHQHSNLDIRIQTYVTQKRQKISTHVFRWLLEKHRTEDQPCSPLTGLINPTHFGRPNVRLIMDEHYEDMCKAFSEMRSEKSRDNDDEMKVGVFFCGPPVIGVQLADRCRALTVRAASEGRKIEYHFMMEVFG